MVRDMFGRPEMAATPSLLVVPFTFGSTGPVRQDRFAIVSSEGDCEVGKAVKYLTKLASFWQKVRRTQLTVWRGPSFLCAVTTVFKALVRYVYINQPSINRVAFDDPPIIDEMR